MLNDFYYAYVLNLLGENNLLLPFFSKISKKLYAWPSRVKRLITTGTARMKHTHKYYLYLFNIFDYIKPVYTMTSMADLSGSNNL